MKTNGKLFHEITSNEKPVIGVRAEFSVEQNDDDQIVPIEVYSPFQNASFKANFNLTKAGKIIYKTRFIYKNRDRKFKNHL
jgi:hypothetical protein